MNRFDLGDINDHNYRGGVLTDSSENIIRGNFPMDETEKTGLVSFYFRFYFVKGQETDVLLKLRDIKGSAIISFCAAEAETGYKIKLCISEEAPYSIEFRCESVSCSLYRYKGMSYRNIYDKINFTIISDAVHDGHWGEPKDIIALSDDLTLIHWSNGYGKYIVQKDGSEVYSFLNFNEQVTLKNPLIHHSNGQRYLLFHVDLYGISLLNPDSCEVYNYVPEGYQHDYRYLCGESFIITDVHYDIASDLVAYGGCWWAGGCEIYIGDMKYPMHFDPHMLRLHDYLDPEWEDIEDIDFLCWEPDELIVSCDGKETAIPIDVIRKKLLEMDKSEITDL